MMPHYFGIQKVTFDERGRLALPSALRAEAAVAQESAVKFVEGMELIVSVHVDGAITFYKEPLWIAEVARQKERHRDDPERLDMWQRLESFAEKQRIDSMGRIMVSESLLNFADIAAPSKKGAYLSVETQHFRVWGEAGWQDEMNWLKSLGKHAVRARASQQAAAGSP